jgi:peroxiredoxin
MLTRQTVRLIPIMILITVGIVLSLSHSHTTTAQQFNYDEELKRGKDLYGRGRYLEALRSFERANELREKKSAECYGWMTDALLAMGAYKQVVHIADASVAFANGDRHVLVRAYNKGLALQALAKQRDELKLRDAEATFRQGIALPGAPAILRYNLGVTLLQLNRDEEGLVELKEYLKQQPNGSYSETARQLIANTRRARESYAPDFSLTTAEGEHIKLKDLRGKVVLLDFWASWCGPCVQSVPELRDLYRRYRRDGLVIIGISSDDDELVWKEFTTRTRMLWPQYRDANNRLHSAFNIRALPTYILLDQEGIVRFMAAGWQKPGKLDNAILKHIKLSARN